MWGESPQHLALPVNRINQRFEELARSGRKGLVIYIGAGDPNLDVTRELARAFTETGVDVLELGVPFSDPLADGVVNQLAAQRGLASGTTPAGVLATVSEIRRFSEIPLVLYIYYNLMHRVGVETFIRDASAAGVDGLLVLDLPPEESEGYEALMKKSGLCPIWLIAPTTPVERIQKIAGRASGFVYYVSREGVTGMQQSVSANIGARVSQIREATSVPVAVGFGISNPAQACEVARHADAVVVGSAVVHQIGQIGDPERIVKEVGAFVGSLRTALDAAPEVAGNV